MKILFIEDHPLKQAQINKFVVENFSDCQIESKNSYISGLKELIKNHSNYDVLLLDISMPNYDISSEDSGGDWMPLAGKNILKEMYLRDIPTKAIVVTMHGSFDDGTKITELDSELKKEFSDNYIGYVFYSQLNEDWKDKICQLLKTFEK
ncbi:Two-component system response regulatory protein [Flavobacterium indicum GPTSA100-9 = DSM 17447]|uniref:Two-component system response regulatory protein n=1 Tax=Flavobacterium indicum (strain DSM 17447 / CIP 109464 / GPTSA100-9) TaxID=1094466 RepID=H8XP75_FLAIG|nr:response regulator [Flavobacterium indicum]CCG53149.1 Two-component system response regulatory protein [Flavobacterium indicum GPTSA100-9 = DSM 17447]